MVSFRFLALLAAAGLVAAQEISTLEPCAQTCYGDTRAQFAKYGCASPDDLSCMCPNADFKRGLEDCAKAACADPNYFGILVAAVNNVCATAVPAAPAPPSTTSVAPAPSTPAPAPTTTSAPPPAATSSSASTSLSSSVSTSATPTESAARLTSSSSTAPSSTGTSSATKAATTSHSSTTAAAAPAATTSAPPAADQPEGGLTTATKIGIGVGSVAAAVAVIGIVICMLLRRRQNNRNITIQTKDWKISEPMPISGRAYGHDYSNSYETGLSELEMKSRRYEDMLPRQVPRQMV